jgi:Flp pilus assembly protein TadD
VNAVATKTPKKAAREATDEPAPEAAPPPDSVALAIELEQAGKLAEAQACLDRVLERSPDEADAVHLAGVLAFRAGRRDEAARLMERSLGLGAPKHSYFRNLCEVYRNLGRYDEALVAGRKATAAMPNDPIAQINLAVLHYARGEPGPSIAAAERALAIDANLPAAHFALAEAYLLQGEFDRGWEEYEWRFRLKGVPSLMPKNDLPQWDGAPMTEGRLMLIADQGFGDCIQFARYIPWVAARASEVVVACGREMRPLIGQLPGVKLLFERWDDCPPCTAFCPLSGLPRLHGTRLDTIPADIPYLRPGAAKVASWAARLEALCTPRYRRIGLAWAGRPTHLNDHNRSVALSALAPIAAVDGVTLVSLQKGSPQAQVGSYFGRAPLINLGPEIADFDDTMAIMEGLERVITVDTSIAHLAGAMGKPAWILLPHAADWRWLEERADTPWYPSVRLFRQPQHGDWESVTSLVAEALSQG